MKQKIHFEKMHGIGNDFVLIDVREQPLDLSISLVRALSDRHTGIGFDQLLIVDDSKDSRSDAAYRFYNPDGSQAEQCGNGQRCISYYLHSLNPDKTEFCLSGLAGIIKSEVYPDGIVRVNMGAINAIEQKTYHGVVCHQVDFGNPHLVTVVASVDACDLSKMNDQYTKSYPEGINFEVLEVLRRDAIKIRVHERGTGETLACGSGACASVAALQQNGQLANKVKVSLPGGSLVVEYRETTNTMYLSGPAVHVFSGEIEI
jgi:diaminopimelate epimerase